MNERQKDRSETGSTNNRRGLEILLFLVVSAVGIYGLGQGLTGLFELGQGINLIWLAVTGIAFMIPFAQMGRVKDTWPRLRDTKTNQVHQTTDEEAAQSSVQAAER